MYMARGQTWHAFAGTNSAYGFYSFFNEVANSDARRIFILKGGPGSGKSTFMRYIAEHLLADGFDVEFFHCSADNSSIDGFHVPQLGVVMFDGTSPHIMDPRWPNAVDEIIDLGAYCDTGAILSKREVIIAKTKANKESYQHAYNFLAAAKIFLSDIEEQVSQCGALDRTALSLITNDLIHEIFGRVAGPPRPARIRRLFASAITPDGFRNYLDSVFDPLEKRYILKGHWGTGKGTILKNLFQAAVARGHDLDCFYCALDPNKLEHMVIKDMGIGIVTSSLPHLYVPRNGDIVIDTAQAIDAGALAAAGEDISVSRNMYGRSLELALGWLARAKKQHKELEGIYTPHMDFEGINKLRVQVLERIRGQQPL